jgi:hypothetical protein
MKKLEMRKWNSLMMRKKQSTRDVSSRSDSRNVVERCNRMVDQDEEAIHCNNNNTILMTLATRLVMMMLTTMDLTNLFQDRLDMLILLDEAKLRRRVVTQANDPSSTKIGIHSGVGEEVTGAEGAEIEDVAGGAIRTSEVEVMDTLFRLNRNNTRHRLRAQGRFHHHFNLKEVV